MDKIKVTVHFTGVVDVKKIASGESVSLPAGADVSALLSELEIAERHKKYVVVHVGGRKQGLSHKLKDNDEVKLFLPIGGG
ncbi:MAG TPA: MoaD/ThiS family protein [Elusimicrobiota bacterium]|nr:MoaD/ThiS family protein [Elusimicrobiota bacterium]